MTDKNPKMICRDCGIRPIRFKTYCKECRSRRSKASREKNKKVLCARCGKNKRRKMASICHECLTALQPAKSLPKDILDEMILCEQKRIEAEERLLVERGHVLQDMTAYEADRYLCEDK